MNLPGASEPREPRGPKGTGESSPEQGEEKDGRAAFPWPWSAALLQLQQGPAVPCLCLLLHGAAKELLREERKLWDKRIWCLKQDGSSSECRDLGALGHRLSGTG